MKRLSILYLTATAVTLGFTCVEAYERLQGPTEVLFWNKTNAYPGYTFFAARSNAYLINMEGRVLHTWPLGTNPRLLTNGNILDATSGDVSGFTTLKEVDWNGSTTWQYTESRTNYAPHHDFIRIYNPKLGTNTTLYLAAKTILPNACIAAGCNPANGPYTNAQVDAVVEVDMAGNVVWEWCFFDHGIQDFDASKSNYVGAGKSVSNYVGRLNLNLPGRPVTNDWLHCNSIDYNQTLDQIVVNAAGGEFYVIDHGNTFVPGNPASSIALAASTNGDFLYRFGDPARYNQGNPPSINQNWTTSTTGNKQIGGSSHAQWIASGLPGAGQFLVYNNGGDLFETTPQSYVFQINGYLNSGTNDTSAYVNPPTAGYYNWAAPGHDTDKRTKAMSRQITWMYYSMANQGMFSHLDSSVQRLPNGNTLMCDSTEGHIFEVTATGEAVWEYINPVSAEGIIAYKRDSYPMQNVVFRAYRFATNHPAFAGRTLTPASTISGQSPSYISAPGISSTTISPAIPTAASGVWVTAVITNARGVAWAALRYIVGNSTNTVTLLDDGAHQDGAASDGLYGGQIPALPAGTSVTYYVTAQDEFGLGATDPVGAPASRYSYVVQAAGLNTAPALAAQIDRTVNPGYTLMVTNVAWDADLPAQTLTFSLLNPPANASMNATSGVVVFSPTIQQLGTTNLITVVVTDDGTPAKSATNAYKAIVLANTSPMLAPVSDRTIEPGNLLVITNTATDPEVPPQLLRYELAVGPTGASINPTNGLLTWQPTLANAGTTNDFLVAVEDNGVPSLLDWQWFRVIVSGTSAPESYDLVLGRPTDASVTVSVLAKNDLQIYFEYGTQPGVYTGQTVMTAVSNSIPSHLTIGSLAPNQRYYYRLRHLTTGGPGFSAGPERTFVTQRNRGSTFTFDIEADPHNRDNEPAVWGVALTNMLADQPDFMIDLGDVFMEEKISRTNAYYLTKPGIFDLHNEVRTGFLSIIGHSVPTFLVNGNHEAELGWLLTGTNSPGVWGAQARQYYFPVPVPGGFYSGATSTDPYTLGPRDGYYAFEWGDALFVALDPFWFTSPKPGLDGWGWTLGANQYTWLKQTLESSTAKFKFVFVHHLVGGAGGGDARGGLENAPYFEWGGNNTNGTSGFAANRPGWAMPIQSLLLSNGVQAVFHGHDHLYVKQDLDADGDGITDLVYQEVPQPSRTNYNSTGAAVSYGYTNGVIVGNSGHLRVTVSPTNARVEYVRAFLPTDEGTGKTNRMVSHSYAIAAAATTNASFDGNIVLGRPTFSSITASVLAYADLTGYLEYGSQPGTYLKATPVMNLATGQPVEIVLNQLQANTRYYYRLRFKSAGQSVFQAEAERSFYTQRAAGSSFRFEVQGDSHPERSSQFNATLYTNTLLLAAADQPDFYLCIGDDFSVDTIPTNMISRDLVAQRYALQRPYLGLVANSASLFLVNGNHEQAAKYLLDGTSNNVAVWAGNARNFYYPMPAPDGFYTGDTEVVPFVGLPRDYYAWSWGDALFVTIDPYWHCEFPVDNVYGGAAKRTNWWDVTHGEAQYQWLKTTLEQSTAKYKFVFAHHVLGSGRGGTDEAPYYEWGGLNADGAWGFDVNRPGWALPIHQLMASNRVTAFIQGHDHIFARQQLDGVAYITLPEPADPNYALDNADAYTSIYETNNSGRVRFTVSPERVKVEYVRSYLPADEGPGRTNNMVDYAFYLYPSNVTPVTSNAWSMLRLPDTGQTQGFTSTFGEDADYTVNSPSFTDNGDGTVKDNVTGLHWQKADGGEMTWSNAVLYAQTNRVGGQSDWRLPSSHEAFSILNHGLINPALDTNFFTLSAAKYWWTADKQISDSTRVWAINAGGGIGAHRMDETLSAGGTNRYHVRCVRGVVLAGQPVHHFTNNLDGTVTDLDTGLTWQQAETFAMNWEAALAYAEGLSLASKTDWRLPNIKELQSINDETRTSPSLDTNFFAGANATRHWSSTTINNKANLAWWVDFQLGLVSYDDKQTNLFVRCVRGGVTNSPPPSTNSFTPQFVKIPAGSYQMGDHFGFVDPQHPSDEIPLHTVYVDSFSMETTLLTCLEYVQFLNSALAQGLIEVRSNYIYGVGGTNIYCDTYGSDTNSRVQWSGSAFSVRDGRELHPITGIRWFGAIAYCNWASAREGLVSCYNLTTGDCVLTNSGYRLPTEAEWEYAARGGLFNPYGMFPWGSDTNADGTLANWAGKTNPFATGPYPWTTPVGFYNGSLQSKSNFNWPAADATYQTRNNGNGFGLYDMSGNIWEWVNDWYANNYYTNCVLNNIVTNPPGPLTGSLMPDGKPYRGLRGGNWFNGQDQYGHARVANRNPSYYRGPGDPNGPWFHIGFRVMRRGSTSVVASGATLTNLAAGLHFTEGPAADAEGNVFFSDIPADTIYKWSVPNQLSVFRTNSGGANGLFFDASGNLVTCEGDNGRITSLTPQGGLTVMASNYAGLRFNEPNDLWIDPAGGVYFTDPTYFGHAVVQGGEFVYYVKPDRSAVLRVASDTVRPNGLVGTPDGKTLYLADWGATNVFRYGINAGGTLTNKTLFARVRCDGMTLDAEGNLYFCENAVLVYDSAGNFVEQIPVPERPTNLEFGGSDRKTMFITTDAGSLYSLRMRVSGATNAVVTTNQPPFIANVAIFPPTPTTNDTVWVTARVYDDTSLANVRLNYTTGAGGGSSQTNTVFLETMATNSSKPWTGIGCNNAWTVTGNAVEQRGGANYGAGNTNGMEFKGGTTNLSDSMITTTSSMNAQGTSGFVEFWMQTLTLSNQYNNAGWTFQLDAGNGYVTRLSELTSTNHTWRLYRYELQPTELVSSLKMRFQFRGGSSENRMDLDQISVKVVSGGGSSGFTNVAMLDDGAHQDGAPGDGTYGASIPPWPVGSTVSYYLIASDSGGLTTTSPLGAPATTFSYTVQGGASNTPPGIANATISPPSPNSTKSVWVTAQVTDNVSVATVTLTYNAGAGATSVTMLDDGLHEDSAAGDRIYGGQIPAFPAGTTVSYYLRAIDNQGAVGTDPAGAPANTYSYTVQSTSVTQTVGLFLNTTNAWPGYTLMAPMHHTNTYLLNNAGEVVHRWTSTYEPGRSAYLMTNGHMFRAGMVKQGGPSTGGGEGGRIEEYDWDGNLVWAIDYYSPTYIHHHDFKVLPNGNVLLLVAEKKTLAEVIAAGFNTNLLDASIFTQGYMLPDCLVEVTPTRPYGGTVVWEWHLWDHMIQDYDSTKNNYGVVANHPELIDVNGTGQKIPQFWNHVNGIDHNAQLDQIMISVRGNSELFVIDHELTTAQAASHSGGRYNKGGDILYRWGNSRQYDRGTAGSQQLYQQHHTHWIETNCPGAGNILIFNNGIGRGYSTINQIAPPMDVAGNYSITAGAAYGPTMPVWTYQSSPATNFYSAEISGAQRLPNGNTLICEGIKGNLFEVTAAGQTVWRYMCPVTTTIMTQGDAIPIDQARADQFMNAVFRVTRYPTNYAGLAGRDLTPQGTIEIPQGQILSIVNWQGTLTGRQFSWSSLPDKNYAVLYKPTLTTGSWSGIATNRSVGTITTFRDSNPVRLNQFQGYYRILQLP